jgi:hypothetical protein
VSGGSAMITPGWTTNTRCGLRSRPRITATMLNFFLGTVAGGLIAGVLTIAAARQPEVQARLGLKPVSPPMALAASPKAPEPDCARRQEAAPHGAAQEILFNRQRFWSVSP